jgi:hypothetical protein
MTGEDPWPAPDDGTTWTCGCPTRPRPEAHGELARREVDGVLQQSWEHGRSRQWPDDGLHPVMEQSPAHGWTLLFPDRQPFAGGPDHRAAHLEDADGYEVELVSS